MKKPRITKKHDFNQQMASDAPLHWSKYTTLDPANNQGQTFMQTLSSFLEHFEGDKQNKSRMKAKANKWLENKNLTKKDTSEEVQELLKLFGID